jgi:predicted ATPase/DNA-binding SARP family transcriptional activator
MGKSSLEIRLLGTFGLSIDAQDLPAPLVKKAQALVGYLAVRSGRPIQRSHLAGVLWPDSDPTTARSNLRQMLTLVRKAAPALAVHLYSQDHETIVFDGSDCWVDAVEFERLAKSNPKGAAAIYRGPFLDGVDLEWVETRRAELTETFLGVVEAVADEGPAEVSVRWLRTGLEADPFRESIVQRILVCLTEMGDIAGAHHVYQRFREQMHRDLHASPSPETTRLVQDLRNLPRTLTPISTEPRGLRRRLPVPTTSILGRDREIATVRKLLESERLVTLTGPGGSGKTRLSIAVGEQLSADRIVPITFVDFSPLDDGAFVLPTVAASLGIRDQANVELLDLLVESLQGTESLLIFDNCEHLTDACGRAAAAILVECQNVRILASSRQPLGVSGEQRFHVPPLELPAGDAVDTDFEAFSAIRFFERCARRVRADFVVTSENVGDVAEICRSVDALPLGIEMAAAKVNAISIGRISAILADKLEVLRGAPQSVRRHQTMPCVIDWSYDLLTEREQALLLRLSVFVGGWTLEAAEKVCSGGNIDEDSILDLLSSLADKCLVAVEPSRDAVRYRLLETIRKYARDRLHRSGQEETMRNIHLDYFLAYAESHEFFHQLNRYKIGKDSPSKPKTTLDPLQAEHDNLRSALEWSRAQPEGLTAFIRIGQAIMGFWLEFGYQSDAQNWISWLDADSSNVSPKARADGLAAASDFIRRTDPVSAKALVEECLAIRRELGDRFLIGTSLAMLGGISMSLCDYSSARKLYEEAQAVKRDVRWTFGGTTAHIGAIAMFQGDYESARSRLDEAIVVLRDEVNDALITGWALAWRGDTCLCEGDISGASGYFLESLALSRERAIPSNVADSIHGLGKVAYYLGDYDTASAHFEEVLSICRNHGFWRESAFTLTALGLVALRQNKQLEARSIIGRGLAIHRRTSNLRGIAECFEGLAVIDASEGRLSDAARMWGSAESLRERIGAPIPIVDREDYMRRVAEVRAAADPAEFDRTWTLGRNELFVK